MNNKSRKIILASLTAFFAPLPAFALPVVPPVLIWGAGILASIGAAYKTAELTVTAIAHVFLNLSALIMGIAGAALDYILRETVVKMSAGINQMTGIPMAWTAIRDVVNILFIFILLWVAINAIINNTSSEMKNTLKNVIIAAVLVNFSLFFTRVMVDTSNTATLFLYRQVVGVEIATDNTSINGNSSAQVIPKGLAAAFSNQLKLTKLLGENLPDDDKVSRILIVAVMGSAFQMIAAVVFLAIAIMFLIRYVFIIFLMAVSPIAFLQGTIPKIDVHAKKWWSTLTNQLIFPPIYMLLTWITVTIISRDGFISNSPQLSAALFETTNSTPTAGMMVFIMNFMIVIIFLISTLVISREVAQQGGSFASKIVGAGFGVAAFAGRQVGGRLGTWAANNKRLQAAEMATAEAGSGFRGQLGAFATRMAARTAGTAARRVSTGSFDVRGGLGGVAGALGLGEVLGETPGGPAGGKGGYVAERDAFREYLALEGSKAARERVDRAGKAALQLKIEEHRALDMDAVDTARNLDDAQRSPAQKQLIKEIDELEKAISTSSDKEIEALFENNKALMNSRAITETLTNRQLEVIMKSDKFSEQEKRNFADMRFQKINNELATGGALTPDIIKQIQGLSDTELDLNIQHFKNKKFMGALKTGQVDTIKKSKVPTKTQIADAARTRREAIEENVSNDPATVRKMDPKDVAKLDTTTLSHPELLQHLSPKKLKQVFRAIEDDDQKVDEVKTALEGLGGLIQQWTGGGVAAPAGVDVAKLQQLHSWTGTAGYRNIFS